MEEEAKKQAIMDMIEDAVKHNYCLIAFRVKLNPIMDELVEQHHKEQEKITHKRKNTFYEYVRNNKCPKRSF